MHPLGKEEGWGTLHYPWWASSDDLRFYYSTLTHPFDKEQGWERRTTIDGEF
jgi:hypothetical protein